MRLTNNLIGREVVAFWGTGGEKARGKLIGISHEPVAIIELADGTQFHWTEALVALPDPCPECGRALVEKTDHAG